MQWRALSLTFSTSLTSLINEFDDNSTSNISKKENTTIRDGTLCANTDGIEPSKPLTDISMDKNTYTLANDLYYYTILTTHVPIGFTCDKYGVRNIIIGSSVVGTILAAIYPTVLSKTNAIVFMVHRVFQAIIETMVIVSSIHLVSHWTLKEEYTVLQTLCNCGFGLGSLYCEILISTLLFIRWDVVFYIISSSYFIIMFLDIYLVYNNPLQSPFASTYEKERNKLEMGEEYPERIPWMKIIFDGSIWALVAGQNASSFVRYFLFLYVKIFMRDVIGINTSNYHYALILCHVGTIIMPLLWSLLAQYFINKKMMPVLFVRTFSAGIGNITPFIFVLLSTYTGCLAESILICHSMGAIFRDIALIGTVVNILDITRYYCGLVNGIVHGWGRAIAGLTVPKMLYVFKLNSVDDFRLMTCAVGSICLFLTILYYVWADASKAEWDTVETEEDLIELRLQRGQRSHRNIKNLEQ